MPPDLRGRISRHAQYWPRRKPVAYQVEGTYADPTAKVNTPVKYLWTHSTGELITAIAQVGLVIEFFHEFEWFDPVLTAAGTQITRTPPQAPRANAHAKRRVGTARRECTDRMLILGQQHPTTVPAEYTQHHDDHRPHRALAQQPSHPVRPTPRQPAVNIQRHPIPDGLINEYSQAA